MWQALSVLVAATAAPALAAELVSRALESTAAQLGLTTFFLGVIVNRANLPHKVARMRPIGIVKDSFDACLW
jgi:hypothetical protein